MVGCSPIPIRNHKVGEANRTPFWLEKAKEKGDLGERTSFDYCK